ncbi:MAG: hypothetical protein ACOYUZ_01685 [Patescibacteria group bacterium]
MPKIIYPFAAIPNHIIRGGHGLTNIGVLNVLMTHGRSTASLQTLADEIGCKRETIRKGLKYWQENGEKAGLKVKVTERNRQTYIIEIEVTRCEEATPQKGVRERKRSYPPKGDDLTPQKGVELPPKRGTKEEPSKKIKEEDKITPLPPTGGIVAQPRGGIDQSYFDNPRQEIQIIGLYAQAKQCVFENIEQAQSFVRRNLLPARNLKGYRYERIHEVMNYLVNNANFKWTLETVAKYIDEDLARNNKNSIPTIQIEKLIRVEEL